MVLCLLEHMQWISGTKSHFPLLLLGLCIQNYKYRVIMVMESLEKSGYFKIVWKSNKQSKVMELFLVYICFSGFTLSA